MVFKFYSLDIACQVVMICWSLWMNKNNIIWKIQKWSLVQILTTAYRNFTQWNEAKRLRLQVNDKVLSS